jgi:hypothetical protein
MKFPRAISWVKWLNGDKKKNNVSKTISDMDQHPEDGDRDGLRNVVCFCHRSTT